MKLIPFSLCLPLALVGCSSNDAQKSASSTATVRGALALSTFAAAPTAVQAVDELGVATRGVLKADGTFTLVLPQAHTYRLTLITASSSEPIVFPRSTGKLDTTFRMAGGGAVVALGTVRHYDAAPAGGFVSVGTSTQLLSSDPAAPVDPVESDGECVDGADAATGAVCVDDDAQATCAAGDGDGETNDDGKAAPDAMSDGECKNGVDAKTGAACTDPEDGMDAMKADPTESADGECEDGVDVNSGASCVDSDADPAKPMAVPEHNAPDEVAGCDQGADGEEKDD